ncbi:MAG: trigger factor [Oscillospiraceae bacterium]|nr:trigger factor [Oscillospiraceae bacterium]
MEIIRNEKVAENTVELEFKVSAEEFEKALSSAFRKANKEITVPGFRKGKAPRNVVEKMFGQEIFFNDAIDEILPQAYEDAVKEAGLVVVARPELDIPTCSKEEGFTVKAVLTTYPEVKLGQYKGLKVEKTTIPVSDELIEAELMNLQDRNARLVSVSDRPAQLDDTANIDFEGFADGVAFEGGKGEGFDLLLGSGQFIPGFEEQIVGHNVGDEFDVEVTFPTEYHAEDLAGKPAVFKTKINELKVKELPEIDDEFAKDVSEFDTLEELKANIKEVKGEEADRAAEMDMENKLVSQVVEGMEANIPEAMYETRVDDMVNDFANRLSQQGLSIDVYLQYTQMDMESFRKTFREQAEEQVKIRLALEAVVKAEDITASDEEYEEELMKAATAYNFPLPELKKMIPVEEVKHDLAVQKAIDFIKANAEITNA